MVSKSKNPLVAAVLIFIFLILLKLTPEKKELGFKCCISPSSITYIEGVIKESPATNSKQTYYSTKIDLSFCKAGNVSSTSSGVMQVYFPVEIIEAFFPGKLYSLSKDSASLIESGSFVQLYGNFTKNAFYVSRVASVKMTDSDFGFKRLRAYSRQLFRKMMFSWGNAGGLLLSLLAGSREYTSINLSDSFRKAGLSHVLALSGMHLSILMGIAVVIGDKLKNRKLMLSLQLISITIFVWFAGFSPSLLRAFICSFVLLFEELVSIKKSDMIEVLAFSFLVQVTIRSDDLFTLGFILSYGALCGILLFSSFFKRIFTRFTPGKLACNLAASAGAQTTTIPVSLKFFGAINPIGIISTVFVSPLISLFIYSGLIFIIISLMIPQLVTAGGIFLNLQYNLIVILVDFFAGFPSLILK